MKLGLIGLPMTGKTTIFNALTGANRPLTVAVPGKIDVQLAVVNVPDFRLDKLFDLFLTDKKIHARVTYADIGGLTKGISSGLSGQFRSELSQMDGFLHVIRAFEDPSVPHTEETIDPQRDFDILCSEFFLSDLIAIENRIKRLSDEIDRGKDRAINQKERDLFERLQSALEEDIPLRELDFTPEELKTIRGYGFLTLKPQVILLNVDESETRPPEEIIQTQKDVSILAIHGQIEAEISQLDREEALIFLSEYNIDEPVRDRVIKASYNLLSLQTFFTVGDDECRAWAVKRGATAHEAAGIIHTDLQRGFIRAEIITCDDLIELGGLSQARQAGKLRLEGKTYVMRECDVMSVRFNV